MKKKCPFSEEIKKLEKIAKKISVRNPKQFFLILDEFINEKNKLKNLSTRYAKIHSIRKPEIQSELEYLDKFILTIADKDAQKHVPHEYYPYTLIDLEDKKRRSHLKDIPMERIKIEIIHWCHTARGMDKKAVVKHTKDDLKRLFEVLSQTDCDKSKKLIDLLIKHLIFIKNMCKEKSTLIEEINLIISETQTFVKECESKKTA